MATITIKNLPDSLYKQLKARAAGNRRSINSEAILAIERAVAETKRADAQELLVSLRQARARLKGVFVTDAGLRAARTAGRQ